MKIDKLPEKLLLQNADILDPINKTNKKSAKLALFQASLDQVNQGKIEINQKFHFDKIMIILKKWSIRRCISQQPIMILRYNIGNP